MAIFTSDNVTGACPEVMDALIKANSGFAPSYGNDTVSYTHLTLPTIYSV